MRPKKSSLRQLGRFALLDRGYKVEARTGQGLLEGARLFARKEDEELDIAVRTSYERHLSFSKRSQDEWATLPSVDLVLAVIPAEKNTGYFEVIAFDSKVLTAAFDKAWKPLERAKRAVSFEMPIFIPLDSGSRKNLGHDLSNLKVDAVWSVNFGPDAIKARTLVGDAETFLDRVKREFAERNEVDVSKVVVEFRIVT